MKAIQKVLVGLMVVATLILSGCPSPTGGLSTGGATSSDGYVSTATVEEDPAGGGFVFVEEDGSLIPLVGKDGKGPAKIIDFRVLDDADGGARCIIVGLDEDGNSGVWIVYEGGVEYSAMLEMVEIENSPWLGDGWVYEAKKISPDGRIVIGQLSRPDGWKYLKGDVPEPVIAVWWVIEDTGERVLISRARPMLMMYEPAPEDSVARCHSPRPIRNWLEMLIEWLQAFILNESWNYMYDAEAFVASDDVEGGIPAGYYVVSGPDKYGVASRAWLTVFSMEDILPAPEAPVDPPVVSGPFPVIGPVDGMIFYQDYGFALRYPLETATEGSYTDIVSYHAVNLPDFLSLDGNEVVADRRIVPPPPVDEQPDGGDYDRSVGFYTVDADGNDSEVFWMTIYFPVYTNPEPS